MLCGCLGIFGWDIAVRIVSERNRAEQSTTALGGETFGGPGTTGTTAARALHCSNSAAVQQMQTAAAAAAGGAAAVAVRTLPARSAPRSDQPKQNGQQKSSAVHGSKFDEIR